MPPDEVFTLNGLKNEVTPFSLRPAKSFKSVAETQGLELMTHPCSHRTSLRSMPGTGFQTAETDAEKRPFNWLRRNLETRRRERLYFRRDKREVSERISIPMTVGGESGFRTSRSPRVTRKPVSTAPAGQSDKFHQSYQPPIGSIPEAQVIRIHTNCARKFHHE
jgi:hypothetical protein